MPNCTHCSAPMPVHTTICKYCSTRNDVDLKGIHEYTVTKPDSERICPACSISMQTINVAGDGKYYIERCDKCMGLFFDPGELEALIDKSVINVFRIDYKGLDKIIKDRSRQSTNIQYVKCPVCSKIMNRLNFAKRSGVIIDRCKAHGIWLEGGQLKQLMEWRKAGGRLLHDKRVEEEKKRKSKKTSTSKRTPFQSPYDAGTTNLRNTDLNNDLFSTVSSVIFNLFK